MTSIISGLVFAMLLTIGLYIATRVEQTAVIRRMQQIRVIQETEPILAPEMTKSWRQRIVLPLIENIAAWVGSLAPGSLLDSNKRRLQRAGHPWGLTAESFMVLRGVSIVGGVILAAVLLRMTALPSGLDFIVAASAGGAGLLGPSWLIDRIANQRCLQIKKALPNVIDLLVVSIEAGLGLDGAISEIIQRESGPLVEEFDYALTQIRLGKRRRDAWRNLAERTQVNDLSAFMAALCQAEELGASIAQVLRTHSDTLRTKRSIHVRELANTIPIKMLFPLIFCIFPSMFIVILGPGALQVMHTLGKLGG